MLAMMGSQKDTDDLTGKATEGSTKITSEAAKMAEGTFSHFQYSEESMIRKVNTSRNCHVSRSWGTAYLMDTALAQRPFLCMLFWSCAVAVL